MPASRRCFWVSVWTVCLGLEITLARKSGAKKCAFCIANEQCAPSSEDFRFSTKVSFLSFFRFVVFLSQIIWIAAVYLTIAAVHLTII